MNTDILTPVSNLVLAHIQLLPPQALGHKVSIHTEKEFPDLQKHQLAIIGVLENRNDVNYVGDSVCLQTLRKAFYSLYIGNWETSIADLGDIQKGETVQDTYFALNKTVKTLLQQKIIPVVIGGSQDLVYPMYRAYDHVMPMINLVNVDSQFNLGDSNLPLKNDSFVGKAIVNEPYNLFNYVTIGYQTYFNSQEEINLMEKLFFEAYRLGDVHADIKIVEPVMRDANLVSVDLNAIKATEIGSLTASPNGLAGHEACAIARYAGISNKVSGFGIFELSPKYSKITAALVAQMVWYFIEGVNCRVADDDFLNTNAFTKYTTLTDTENLTFYRSNLSDRWWVEIPFMENVNNKLKKHTLLPCMHQDYMNALKNQIPERWLKAVRKNSQ